MNTHSQVIVYTINVLVYCLLYCIPFYACYDRSLVNITSPISCLVSMNSSLDDLTESAYYMLIPMQHINVLRIFTSFCINTQSNYICKIPCLETKSRKLSLQKWKSPLALWPPRGVTSIGFKRPHFSDPPCFFLVSSLVSHPLSIFWLLGPRAGATASGRPQHNQSAVLLNPKRMRRMWAPQQPFKFCARPCGLDFPFNQWSSDISRSLS